MVMLVALRVKAVLQGQCVEGVGIMPEWELIPFVLLSPGCWQVSCGDAQGCVAVQLPPCAQGGLSVTLQVSWASLCPWLLGEGEQQSWAGLHGCGCAVPGGAALSQQALPLQSSVPSPVCALGRTHGSGQAGREGWAAVFAVLNVEFPYQLQWGQLFRNNMSSFVWCVKNCHRPLLKRLFWENLSVSALPC